MTRKCNNHRHVQSFVVGQYCPDRVATGDKRILCRTVDIAGSKEQPGYKLRRLYGATSNLCSQNPHTAIPRKFHLYHGNEATLAHAAS